MKVRLEHVGLLSKVQCMSLCHYERLVKIYISKAGYPFGTFKNVYDYLEFSYAPQSKVT